MFWSCMSYLKTCVFSFMQLLDPQKRFVWGRVETKLKSSEELICSSNFSNSKGNSVTAAFGEGCEIIRRNKDEEGCYFLQPDTWLSWFGPGYQRMKTEENMTSNLSAFIPPNMRQWLTFCKTSVFLITGVTGLVISTDDLSCSSSSVR